MTSETEKPAATPATRTATATKPAAPRTAAAAKPARRRTPAAAKPEAVAAKKPATAKSAPAGKTGQAAKPAATKKADKPAKAKKVKLVRDSFTMPETEYAAIASLKKRCLTAGVSVKKSEILRAAMAGLAKLSDASVVAAIRRLDIIKTGRPAKGSK
jgi:hypothetical protein